mgnify:CR=1 FL=1
MKKIIKRIKELTRDDQQLQSDVMKLIVFSRKVRTSEYHITNLCNLRCKGCWYYNYEFDKIIDSKISQEQLVEFVLKEKKRKINSALLIGGEPTLVLDRIKVFVNLMQYVTISTNGLKQFPHEDFENVTVAVSLFEGGPCDDEIRGQRSNGKRIQGLFDKVLSNYKNDKRVVFIYAVSEAGIDYIEETVKRIYQNGNKVSFNYYSYYGNNKGTVKKLSSTRNHLLAEIIRVKDMYSHTVANNTYFLKTLITQKSHWASFSYNECPSISIHHHEHKDRLLNGNPTLPFFNTYAADFKTIEFCCTSGKCDQCYDSQAIFSWILVNIHRFLSDKETLSIWAEIAMGYWRHFIWSPFHWSKNIVDGKKRITV